MSLAERADASQHPSQELAITALMPQPRSIDYGDGWLPMAGGFQVEWLGHHDPMLNRAVSRFQADVARRTGLDVRRTGAARLRVDCRGEDDGYLTIDARERYSLAVEGDAVLLVTSRLIGAHLG